MIDQITVFLENKKGTSPPSRAVWTLEGAGFKALTQADL